MERFKKYLEGGSKELSTYHNNPDNWFEDISNEYCDYIYEMCRRNNWGGSCTATASRYMFSVAIMDDGRGVQIITPGVRDNATGWHNHIFLRRLDSYGSDTPELSMYTSLPYLERDVAYLLASGHRTKMTKRPDGTYGCEGAINRESEEYLKYTDTLLKFCRSDKEFFG